MKNVFIVIGVLTLVLSIVFFALAYDKFAHYHLDEKNDRLNKNAYVGGDAYNYIVNGTYFTGFSVLGVGSLLIAILSFGFVFIGNRMEDERVSLFRKMNEIERRYSKKIEN